MKPAKLACAVLALFFFCSCASAGADHHPGPGASMEPKFISADLSQYKKIAVLDFSEGPQKEGAEPDICSLAGLSLNQGPLEKGSGIIVADQFHIQMTKLGFPMTAREKARETAAMAGEDALLANGAKLAALVAETSGADALLMGCVARYEELAGNWLIADKPAHVAFGATLFDPRRQEVVWAGKFDKKQRSLFADLWQWRLFFRGGMVWQTAETLSFVGAGFLAESIPTPERGK